MDLIQFTDTGWRSWDVERRPLLRGRIPILIDDDLRFEDPDGSPRPAMVANLWLRGMPVSGAPAERSWVIAAGCLRDWLVFLQSLSVSPLGEKDALRAALSKYDEYRFSADLADRWDVTTWNLHVRILSSFYAWATSEGHARAVPFTYATGKRLANGVWVEYKRNQAKRRQPLPHVSIKHLEPDFAQLFVRVLAGLLPDGSPDSRFRGREGARNSAMAALVLSSGLRRKEFTWLTLYEVPPLPRRRTNVPILFPLAAATTKGTKARTTWVGYDALSAVHEYMELDRAASAEGSTWRPPQKLGAPLVVESPDWEGARINGVRRAWRKLTPAERMRLVTPTGRSPLLALQSNGEPFTDWPTVFRRASERIRDRFEPRFPSVAPHRLRHSFAMHTLEWLVTGRFREEAMLVQGVGPDAAMAQYLMHSEPMLVLRDLLGHSSVTTTELYIARLDVQRIYGDAHPDPAASTLADPSAAAEADDEFDDGEED